MIYHHMAIDDVQNMRPSHQRQMFEHDAFKDLLELHRADAGASWRPGQPHVMPQFEAIEELWHVHHAKAATERQPSLKRDLGIDGHWVRRTLGDDSRLTGPVIGRILEELTRLYLDEGVRDERAYEMRARQLLGGEK